MASEPLKIGLLVGREWSFPPAFIEEVNGRNEGVVAEYVRIGAPRMDDPAAYRVIVDRISHEVPMYRTWLKQAALMGSTVRSAFVDSATPGPPTTCRRAAETTSPSTAEAVWMPPAPAP